MEPVLLLPNMIFFVDIYITQLWREKSWWSTTTAVANVYRIWETKIWIHAEPVGEIMAVEGVSNKLNTCCSCFWLFAHVFPWIFHRRMSGRELGDMTSSALRQVEIQMNYGLIKMGSSLPIWFIMFLLNMRSCPLCSFVSLVWLRKILLYETLILL